MARILGYYKVTSKVGNSLYIPVIEYTSSELPSKPTGLSSNIISIEDIYNNLETHITAESMSGDYPADPGA